MCQLQRLQYVKNTAVRVVLQVSKFQYITPVLCELHWLPIQYRFIFKILLLVYKSLNGTSPSYLSQKLRYCSYTRSLRSVSNELLMQPRLMEIELSLFCCTKRMKLNTLYESLIGEK